MHHTVSPARWKQMEAQARPSRKYLCHVTHFSTRHIPPARDIHVEEAAEQNKTNSWREDGREPQRLPQT